MQNSVSLSDIIKRIKEIKHLKSDSQVATQLNMTRNDLYGFQRRKTLPLKNIYDFCAQEGVKLEYILNGTHPIYSNDPGPWPKIPGYGFGTRTSNAEASNKINTASPVTEPPAHYLTRNISPDSLATYSPDVQDAIRYATQAFEILNSGTGYASALRENITWFLRAVENEKRLLRLEDEMNTLKKQLSESGILSSG